MATKKLFTEKPQDRVELTKQLTEILSNFTKIDFTDRQRLHASAMILGFVNTLMLEVNGFLDVVAKIQDIRDHLLEEHWQ